MPRTCPRSTYYRPDRVAARFTGAGRATDRNGRREEIAAAQIEAHVSTLGNHSECDPKYPEQMCKECRSIHEHVLAEIDNLNKHRVRSAQPEVE